MPTLNAGSIQQKMMLELHRKFAPTLNLTAITHIDQGNVIDELFTIELIKTLQVSIQNYLKEKCTPMSCNDLVEIAKYHGYKSFCNLEQSLRKQIKQLMKRFILARQEFNVDEESPILIQLNALRQHESALLSMQEDIKTKIQELLNLDDTINKYINKIQYLHSVFSTVDVFLLPSQLQKFIELIFE